MGRGSSTKFSSASGGLEHTAAVVLELHGAMPSRREMRSFGIFTVTVQVLFSPGFSAPKRNSRRSMKPFSLSIHARRRLNGSAPLFSTVELELHGLTRGDLLLGARLQGALDRHLLRRLSGRPVDAEGADGVGDALLFLAALLGDELRAGFDHLVAAQLRGREQEVAREGDFEVFSHLVLRFGVELVVEIFVVFSASVSGFLALGRRSCPWAAAFGSLASRLSSARRRPSPSLPSGTSASSPASPARRPLHASWRPCRSTGCRSGDSRSASPMERRGAKTSTRSLVTRVGMS